MSVKLKFQVRDLLWLYIPLIKDVKEKEEDSGERPYLLSGLEQGIYELATMTEHFKTTQHQYPIQHETNLNYQGKPINLNTKVYLAEPTLKRIMGNFFNYYRPYRLNEKDFLAFKKQQQDYFLNPRLQGRRYKIEVV